MNYSGRKIKFENEIEIVGLDFAETVAKTRVSIVKSFYFSQINLYLVTEITF